MTKIYIGADSGSHKDVAAAVNDAFKGTKGSFTITIENLAPRNFSFPEIGVPLLRNALSRTADTKAVVQISDREALTRAMSSIVQIAQLNGYKVAVALQEAAAAPKQEQGKKQAEEEADNKGKAKPKKE